jgi:hypothetical protein
MIYIIQCLCPQRHAIMAVSYDPEELPHDVAMATFQSSIEEWVRKEVIDPWCGICHSREWHYEPAKTKYKTMEEAAVELSKIETANRASRRIVDQLKAERN